MILLLIYDVTTSSTLKLSTPEPFPLASTLTSTLMQIPINKTSSLRSQYAQIDDSGGSLREEEVGLHSTTLEKKKLHTKLQSLLTTQIKSEQTYQYTL